MNEYPGLELESGPSRSPERLQDLVFVRLHLSCQVLSQRWCVVRTAPPRRFPLLSFFVCVCSVDKDSKVPAGPHAKGVRGKRRLKRHHCFQSSCKYFTLICPSFHGRERSQEANGQVATLALCSGLHFHGRVATLALCSVLHFHALFSQPPHWTKAEAEAREAVGRVTDSGDTRCGLGKPCSSFPSLLSRVRKTHALHWWTELTLSLRRSSCHLCPRPDSWASSSVFTDKWKNYEG